MVVVVPYNQDSYPPVNSHNDGKTKISLFGYGSIPIDTF